MTDMSINPLTEHDDVGDVGSVVRDYPLPFAAFYASNVRRAVSLAWVLTGSRETAEELVHHVMADAHRRSRTVGAYDQPAQWLRRAVLNRSVSTRRRAVARAKGTLRLVAQTCTSSELDARDGQLWATVRRLPNRQGQPASPTTLRPGARGPTPIPSGRQAGRSSAVTAATRAPGSPDRSPSSSSRPTERASPCVRGSP